jgi:hypothetical protein
MYLKSPLRLAPLEDRTVPTVVYAQVEPHVIDAVVYDPGTSGYILQSLITQTFRGEAAAIGSDYWDNSVWNQAQGFMEFELGVGDGPPPAGAKAEVLLPDVGGKNDGTANRIAVSWYVGDGDVTVEDRSLGTPLTTLTTRPAQGGPRYPLDVTEAVRGVREAGGRFLGLRFAPTQASDFESFGVADSFTAALIPTLRLPVEAAVSTAAWTTRRGLESDTQERGVDLTLTLPQPIPQA